MRNSEVVPDLPVKWLIVPADATTIKFRLALRRDLHTTFESRAIV